MASAQEEPLEKELLVSLDVGYTTAYRDKSWVPVDVTITNELKDLDGHIEVRLYDFSGNLQSPIYRVPAECPTDSRKRFRLYAYFNNTEKVEAWIYSGTRPALDVPAYQILSPTVAGGDLLGLILNEDALDFGFLYQAVQTPGSELRFHRHNVPTPLLGTLPEHISCYSAFNAVILGEIEPDRVPEDRRELLRHYVRRGGTVIVMTGENAARYRGTWIEELTGVRIGETEQIKEGALAERLLPPDKREGVKPDRDCVLAQLEPVAEGAKVLGTNGILAVLRPLGFGYVCTLSVDATSHALQDAREYRLLWLGITPRYRNTQTGLGTASMYYYASENIPRMTGVSMQSRKFVTAYLGSYLLIGIVANFLFWGRFKRREWAWVILVAVSAGYAAFAYMYGTSGWAAEGRTYQIDTMRISKGESVADYEGYFGLLAAGSGNHAGSFSQSSVLVKEADRPDDDGYRYGRRRENKTVNPFTAGQQGLARFERMRVGASTMRFVNSEGMIPLDGKMAGTLTLDSSGLHGAFKNDTGLALQDVRLLFYGVYYPVVSDGDTFVVDLTLEQYRSQRNPVIDAHSRWPTEGTPNSRADIARSLSPTLAALAFADGNSSLQPDPHQGPYLTGVAVGAAVKWSVETERSAGEYRLSAVAAEVQFVNLSEEDFLKVPLPMSRGDFDSRRPNTIVNNTLDSVREWRPTGIVKESTRGEFISLIAPFSVGMGDEGRLQLEIYYRPENPFTLVRLFGNLSQNDFYPGPHMGFNFSIPKNFPESRLIPVFEAESTFRALDVDPSGATWISTFIVPNWPRYSERADGYFTHFGIEASGMQESETVPYMAIAYALVPNYAKEPQAKRSPEEFTWR